MVWSYLLKYITDFEINRKKFTIRIIHVKDILKGYIYLVGDSVGYRCHYIVLNTHTVNGGGSSDSQMTVKCPVRTNKQWIIKLFPQPTSRKSHIMVMYL